jgi:cytochrome b
MYAFVLVHLGGVILADNKDSKGLVSGMINGNK